MHRAAVRVGGVVIRPQTPPLEVSRGFGADNIRVNAIEPGAVMTERQRQLWYRSEESVTAMVDRQLIGRVLRGEDIARAVLFLAADDSAMITKQSLIVDAGLR